MSDELVKFDFEWSPDLGSVKLGLEKWATMVDDFSEPFTAIVQIFRKHEAKHFDSEGASTGAPWPKLSDEYAAWKAEHYPGRPILVREGRLRMAIVEGKGAAAITRVGTRAMVVGVDGSSLPYAIAHERGIPSAEYGLAVRPPVRFDGDFRKRGSFGWLVAQVLQAYVVWVRKRAFKDAGLIHDPFLEERFESSVVAAMTRVAASGSPVKTLIAEGLSRLGIR